MSEYTADADGMGVLRLLNAIRSAGLVDKCRFYQVLSHLTSNVTPCGAPHL